MVKNTIKVFDSEGFSYIKLIKICTKKSEETCCVFVGMVSLSKKPLQLHNFAKTGQNIANICMRPFPIKLTKIYHKKEVKFWPQVSFKKTFCFKQKLLWLEKTFHVKQYFISVISAVCSGIINRPKQAIHADL